MTDLLNTGKTALFAFQKALSTTSHNIANVNTEGYARQRVEFDTVTGEGTTSNGTATGVQITSLERVADEFATARVRAATSAHAEQEVQYQMSGRLDNLVADEALSITPALNDFYNALQDATLDPSSVASRGVVLQNAEQLAERFASLQGQLDDTVSEVNERTTQAVDMVSGYAQEIADINNSIMSSGGRENTQNVANLKDQRERVVAELSGYIDVDTLVQENGAMNIYIGKGMNLVTDNIAQDLYTQSNSTDPLKLDIRVGSNNATQVMDSQIQGGIIGGLREFSEDTLDTARHELGRIALGIADQVNEQHAIGIDLNSDLGADLFGSAEPTVYSDTGNTGTGELRGRVTDTTALEASAYTLAYDGANYTATRESDGVSVTGSVPMSIDGLALTMTGTPMAGDSFMVSATGSAAESMEVLIQDAEELALASQLTTSSDISNLGESTISAPTISDPEDIDLKTPVEIVFSSDTTYDIINSDTGAAIVSGATYVKNDPISENGWEISISGNAKEGDTHRIEPNLNGRGDNSNAIALIDTQTALSIGGTESFNDAYGSLVSNIGSSTNAAATRTTALQSLKESAVDRQQSVQGVSLDEEAIDLTRFQQAYQAAAQVITTSETLFQSVLGAIR